MPRGWIRLFYAALITAGVLLAALPFHGDATDGRPSCGSLLSPSHDHDLPDRRCVDSDYDGRQVWATWSFVPGIGLALLAEGVLWLRSPKQPRIGVWAERRSTS